VIIEFLKEGCNLSISKEQPIVKTIINVITDVKVRRYRDQIGLDILVVYTVNTEY